MRIPTRHLFISPHLDDVALSCGGLMADLANRGCEVIALTLFAGTPADDELTPIARELKARWKAGDDPMATRRAEDIAACEILGADPVHLAWADCPYRAGTDGKGLYPSEEALFGSVHSQEATLPTEIAAAVRPWLSDACRVYGPLGAGHHVDHQLARDAALRLAQRGADVWLYEDYPYADDLDAVHRALADCADCARQPRLVQTSPEALAAKLDAVARYRSQIDTFWRDDRGEADLSEMRRVITVYGRRIGREEPRPSPGLAAVVAERYWPMTGDQSA